MRHSRRVNGRDWPGYKLVAGRSVRRYTSEAEVIKAATEAGFTDIYKTTLLGVGDLEKRMGRKKFSEVLGKYVIKPRARLSSCPNVPEATTQAVFRRGERFQ